MKKILALAGTALVVFATTGFSGCGEKFPQYTATYRLVSATYSKDAIKGTKRAPDRIRVLDRMEYVGGSFNHTLKFEALPADGSQASGQLAASLTSLTYTGSESSFPTPDYSGADFRPGRYGNSQGAWCKVSYLYRIHLAPKKMSPGPDLLERVYIGHEEIDAPGADRVAGEPSNGKVKLNLSNPKEAPMDERAVDEWVSRVSEDDGMTLTVRIAKVAVEVMSGCEDGAFPLVDEDVGELVLVYKSEDHWDTLSEDIRKAPVSEAEASPPGFIDAVVSFK